MTILTGFVLVVLGFLFGLFRMAASVEDSFAKRAKKSGHIMINDTLYKVEIVGEE